MGKEAPDLSGLLGGLMQSPAALSTLMGMLGTALGQGEGAAPAPPPEEGEEATAIPASSTPSLPPGGRHGSDRECLVAALSPYLSERRRQAMLGACKLLEVIELLKKRN